MTGRKKIVARLSAGLGMAVLLTALAHAATGAQSSGGTAAAGVPTLDQVVNELNAAAAKFQSAQADFRWDQLQAVVQEHDIQTGTVYYDRHGTTTWMAADVAQEGGQSAPKDVVYSGSQLQLYQPGIKQLTNFRASPDQVESYLGLGFGGSGNSLKANWDVTVMGRETIDGVPVVKLDLKPKTPAVQNTFTHVTIWIDTSRAIALKQVFVQPSGDTSTNTYSNIRYNQHVDESVFHLKLAPGTSIVNK
ncbi:MAG TPA: outer membrane lipoprotein carrier protein LolA [Acidobacteriaceae bacterium]|jgi:outer membrane lipoprotein-sorting protein|nr:outer membrane lipoprotein carrier protein LolA [Acidobacteriaceae bacterium]